MEETKSSTIIKIYMLGLFCFFAVLTGSTGSVIINILRETDISVRAGSLFPISRYAACILAGFFISPYVVKIGYKRSINISLFAVLIASLLMLMRTNVFTSCVFFLTLGLGYTLCKTALFSAIKLVFDNKKSHMSFISLLEGIYMLGVLFSFLLFSLSSYFGNWHYAYFFITTAAILLIFVTFMINIPEYKEENLELPGEKSKTNVRMYMFFKFPIIIFFALTLIAYIILEKGVNDWLPTYNHLIFHIDINKSILLAGIFSVSIALGRLFYSYAVRLYDGNKLIIIFVIISFIITFVLGFFDEITPAALVISWSNIPYTVVILPMLGFFIGPVYPVLISSLLVTFSDKDQGKISGLVIILGGIGSISGTLFMGMIIHLLAKSLVLEFLSCIIVALIIFLVLFFKKTSKATLDQKN